MNTALAISIAVEIDYLVPGLVFFVRQFEDSGECARPAVVKIYENIRI